MNYYRPTLPHFKDVHMKSSFSQEATPTRGVESEWNRPSIEKIALHNQTLRQNASRCRDAFDVRIFFSSADGGFERRVTQADRVTGAEPAGAKAVAGSVTGARCAPHGESS